MSKDKIYSLCMVRRTAKITNHSVNMQTGAKTGGETKVVTQACGTPLFNDEHQKAGVCRSCSEGWEVKDNTFATPEEKKRAMSAIPKK